MTTIVFNTKNDTQTQQLAQAIGKKLKGSEVFELRSDLGGGKTTFVRGLAKGFGSLDPVASPSFTISNIYRSINKKLLYHYDFYRLKEPGIMSDELSEVISNSRDVVVVEWGKVVSDILPESRIVVLIEVLSETERKLTMQFYSKFSYLFTALEKRVV